jgi:hypothetical protein
VQPCGSCATAIVYMQIPSNLNFVLKCLPSVVWVLLVPLWHAVLQGRHFQIQDCRHLAEVAVTTRSSSKRTSNSSSSGSTGALCSYKDSHAAVHCVYSAVLCSIVRV